MSNCQRCGAEIIGRQSNARYCTERCRIEGLEERRRVTHAAYAREHYRTNRIRDLAQAKARAAKLPRPMFCEACGIKPPRDKHHDDYSKPLEVRWLCRSCHVRWHRENPDPLTAV